MCFIGIITYYEGTQCYNEIKTLTIYDLSESELKKRIIFYILEFLKIPDADSYRVSIINDIILYNKYKPGDMEYDLIFKKHNKYFLKYCVEFNLSHNDIVHKTNLLRSEFD